MDHQRIVAHHRWLAMNHQRIVAHHGWWVMQSGTTVPSKERSSLIIKELSLTMVGGLCNQELRFPHKERSSLIIKGSSLTFQASPFKPREMFPSLFANLPAHHLHPWPPLPQVYRLRAKRSAICPPTTYPFREVQGGGTPWRREWGIGNGERLS
jgi:hypothetical protein